MAEGTEPPSLERMRELVAKANSVLAGSGKTCFYVEYAPRMPSALPRFVDLTERGAAGDIDKNRRMW